MIICGSVQRFRILIASGISSSADMPGLYWFGCLFPVFHFLLLCSCILFLVFVSVDVFVGQCLVVGVGFCSLVWWTVAALSRVFLVVF